MTRSGAPLLIRESSGKSSNTFAISRPRQRAALERCVDPVTPICSEIARVLIVRRGKDPRHALRPELLVDVDESEDAVVRQIPHRAFAAADALDLRLDSDGRAPGVDDSGAETELVADPHR